MRTYTVQALIKKSEDLRTIGVLSQLVIHCVWSSDLSWGQQQSEGPSPHWLSKLLCTIHLMLIYCNFFLPVWSFILLLVCPFTGPHLHILPANWTEIIVHQLLFDYCITPLKSSSVNQVKSLCCIRFPNVNLPMLVPLWYLWDGLYTYILYTCMLWIYKNCF